MFALSSEIAVLVLAVIFQAKAAQNLLTFTIRLIAHEAILVHIKLFNFVASLEKPHSFGLFESLIVLVPVDEIGVVVTLLLCPSLSIRKAQLPLLKKVILNDI